MHTRLLVIALLFAGPLAAQSPGTGNAEEARAAYDEGTTEYDLGHYKEALALFEKAFRLRHVPALLFNIAQSHRMLGNLKSAATLFRSFLAKDPGSKGVPQARELLAQVEKALAQQQLAESAPPMEVRPQELEQSLGVSLAPQPTAQLAPPPTIPAAPAEPLQPVVLVSAEPPPAPAASPHPVRPPPAPSAASSATPAPRPAPAPASGGRVFTWVAAGGAALAFGGAAFFGSKSSSAKSDLQNNPHPTTQVAQLQDDQVSNAQRANLLFVAAGVLAAVTAAFFILEF